jgi:hypothetical protein
MIAAMYSIDVMSPRRESVKAVRRSTTEQIDQARLTFQRVRKLAGMGISERESEKQTCRILDGCLRKAEQFRDSHPPPS